MGEGSKIKNEVALMKPPVGSDTVTERLCPSDAQKQTLQAVIMYSCLQVLVSNKNCGASMSLRTAVLYHVMRRHAKTSDLQEA